MPKTFVFLIIGLFFGTGLGFLVAASSGAKLEGHDHNDPAHHVGMTGDHGSDAHAGMNHDTLTETNGTISLALTLHSDGANSRNLQIETTDFAFSPETVNGPHVPGQGHAHVYVNGVKIARAYSPWMQVTGLAKGENVIRVTLNANDHTQLAVDGTPVEGTITVTIE